MPVYLDSLHERNQYLIKVIFLMLKAIVPIFFPSNSGILILPLDTPSFLFNAFF